MTKTPLETAQQQLLAHWRRSGLTHLPAPSADGIEAAKRFIRQLPESDMDLESAPALEAITTKIGTNDAAKITVSETKNEAPKSPKQTAYSSSSEAINSAAIPSSWSTEPKPLEARSAAFEQIDALVRACRKCTDIACYRKQTVFGVGPNNARLVMFGEAPGADEDRVGEPFVGAAGQLLNKILVASGLSRDQVYIMNALKCRPPNNRTPVESEIENCRPYFESQLEVIQPDYIICWGSVAVRAILKTTESVGRLRGRWHSFRGAKVLVTYHPAYLLRSPDAKRLTWEDMKFLMKELGIPIPTPRKGTS